VHEKRVLTINHAETVQKVISGQSQWTEKTSRIVQ